MRFFGALCATFGTACTAVAGRVVVTGDGDQGLAILALVLSLAGILIGVLMMLSDASR